LDARLNDYEFYSCLDYNVFLALNGDCLDRYFLRFNEMVESCRIIYSLLLFLFSSSFLFSLFISGTATMSSFQFSQFSFVSFFNELFLSSSSVSNLLPYSIYSSMELLIYEFLITFPFLLSFLFVLKLSIESSKGIYSIFIMAFPFWTTNIISNDYLALSSINKFCRYINLGDLIAVLGSIDFVLGSIDL